MYMCLKYSSCVYSGMIGVSLVVMFPIHFTVCMSLCPASASVVVTTDEALRGGRTIPLKTVVDEAVEGCECVKTVLVSRRTGADVPMTERDIQLEEVRLFTCSTEQGHMPKANSLHGIRTWISIPVLY